MGCTTSSSTAGRQRSNSSSSKKKKGVDIVDVHPDDSQQMRDDMMQRHDSEVDLTHQFTAEREALKALAAPKINRKLSFEDLMETLSLNDLELLSSSEFSFKLQKEHRIQNLKSDIKDRKKSWVLYNNLEAISDFELTIIAVYLMSILRALNNKDIISSSSEVLSRNSPVSSPSSPQQRKVPQLSVENPDLPTTATALAALRPTNFNHKIEDHIRELPVVNIAPVAHYQVTHLTLYDYELPPGLITINEAKSLIELYRRGGRLVARSVHKILRLAYKLLKESRNITDVTVTEQDKLIVVGDIHGQLADLLHILESAGLPSTNNKYIFNGDFVDRGEWGVEVMCILLALYVARPDCVSLNRGNHEDFAICSVYGFQLECYEKYDPMTFAMFVEVFQQIPLFATINRTVFVVHGGLFHNADVSLDELNEIDRTKFTLEDLPENGEPPLPLDRTNMHEFNKQLTRDALWSDPIDVDGLHESVRGAGVAFGPDVTKAFLEKNNFKLVIRSHECIRSGYDEPFQSEIPTDDKSAPLLCTIFSASDYGGSGNSAAYLEFHLQPVEVSHEDVELNLQRQRTSSTASSQASSQQHQTLQKKKSDKNFNEKAVHNTLKLKDVDLSPKNSGTGLPIPDDNMSDMKFIDSTRLYYQVHYFYADPLNLDPDGEFERDTLAGENLAELSNMTDRNRMVGTNDSTAIFESSASTASSTTTNGSSSLPPLHPNTASLSIQLPKPPQSSKSSRAVSFGGTTLILEESDSRERSLINDIDPTDELLKDRNIVLSSSVSLDELILTRKKLLLESFEKVDFEGKGQVPLKDWIRVMSEILNLSVSWRKIGRYILREEDRVATDPINLPVPHTMTPPGTPLAGSANSARSDGSRVGDGASKRVSFERMNSLQRARAVSAADKHKTQQDAALESCMVKYYAFLERYEDEETKRKKKETEEFTLAILRRYQSSASSTSLAVSADSGDAAAGGGAGGQAGLVTLADYNKFYAPQLQAQTKQGNHEDPYLHDTHFHGYQVPEYVIASIYTNYKQLEHAFNFIDENGDGFFDLHDFVKSAEMLEVNEILSTEIVNYPMIRHIRFSPELIMKLLDINQQDCIDMNSFFEIFRLAILNKLYDHDALSKPLLARETSYSMELHRLTHSNSINPTGPSTPMGSSFANSMGSFVQHSALSSLELKKGVEISVDNELILSNESADQVGLPVDI